MVIRAAVPFDADQISQLLAGSWHRTYDALMGVERVNQMTTEAHAPVKLVAEIEDPSVITLVAVDELGKIIGVAKIEKQSDSRLYLDRLHIDPSAFGTGLADHLFDAAIGAAGPHESVSLEVLAGNSRAIAYYIKRGFVESTKLDASGTALGVSTLLMKKYSNSN